jgi:hypothetical protein
MYVGDMEIVHVVTTHGRRALALPVAAARLPFALVARVDRVLASVETLAFGMASVEEEMRGMRSDVREVTGRVDLLREEFAHVAREVKGIGAVTERLGEHVAPLPEVLAALDGHLDGMTGSLNRIDELASRLNRFGRRGRADQRAA